MGSENLLYTEEDMRAAQASVEREQRETGEINLAVLMQVKALVSSEAFEQIEESLSESGFTHSYQIVCDPVGLAQDDGFLLGQVYVDQTKNGGHSGDDFAGTVCMPITADRYFQFAYCC